jgi:hopanoid biosynthesis associated RND transporter like protein HpnN
MSAAQSSEQPASFAHRLLVSLVEQVCRFPRLVLAVALFLCALSIVAAWTRLEYRTQRSDLINPHKDYQERWQRYLKEFGDDDDIVVVVEDRTAQRTRMEQALEELAAALARQPERFDRLFYKVDLRPLHNRALLFLPTEEIGKIEANLQDMGMLLDPPVVGTFDPLFGWKSLTLLRLLTEGRNRAARIVPEKPLPLDDDQFLTQLLAISHSAAAYLENPTSYRNPWSSLVPQPPQQQDLLAEPRYFFSDDGTLAFLLARPVKEKQSFTESQQSVSAMRAIVAEVSGRFPGLSFGLTGLPVLENDEMTASQQDTNIASWLALAGVAVLYLVVFRSFRSPFLTVTTLLVGTAWAMGWLTLTVGHLNILSATFAVMLIGMGDYGVLWVTRWEEERAAGVDVITAMGTTAGSVGMGILTASVTTSLAFFAAMLADFQAVAELGWIAGSGVLLCALSCFTVLPALICLLARESKIPSTKPEFRISYFGFRMSSLEWLPALAVRPRWVLGITAVLTAILGIFACRVEYDHNLLHLQARDLDSVKWELNLIRHTTGASWHALSYVSTTEEALQLRARYEKLPKVRVVEIASLVPAQQEPKVEQLRSIQRRLKRLPERGALIPHKTPQIREVRNELNYLTGSLQPLADASAQPLLADLRRALMRLREKLNEVPLPIAEERLREFEEHLAAGLAEDLHRLRDVSTPAPIGVNDLPEDLRARYIGTTGKWLVSVFGEESLWEYGPLLRFVNMIRSVDPEATGKPFGTLEGLRAMKHGFQWAGVYALGAIVLVLLIDFRKPAHILLALTPLALGLVLSLGIMGLCGFALNPANMIGIPLILGVGVDNGVHVLHDYLSQRRRGSYTLHHTTGRGIMVAALTTILGFGTLMISHHRGLFGLGFILTLGVTCCMLAALVVLPAMLRLMSAARRTQLDLIQEQPRRERAAA